MKPLHSNIINLTGRRSSPVQRAKSSAATPLREISGFGSNPGALRAWAHVPPGLGADAPLVVVLHGCTQDAAEYDTGAGWSQLADELGFIVLLPEQQRSNNPNLCFNWFSPIDSRRDSGEALSIRQMIAWLVEAHDVDERRIFVTGLSAGGAMASIMLATYPELFAGGAIIAGLPFGTAASVADAFSRMAGNGFPDEDRLAALVRAASPHRGPWPRISVWHGSADSTVNPANADRIIDQWHALHGVDTAAFEEEHVGRHIRRVWRNDAAQVVMEHNIITGMGHGTPLKTHGADACGKAGPYMLEVGTSSTRAIAQSWGLGEMAGKPDTVTQITAPIAATPRVELAAIPKIAKSILAKTLPGRAPANAGNKGVGQVIEDALRAAGLMK